MGAIISWMINSKLQAKASSVMIGSSGVVALILGIGDHLKNEIAGVDQRIVDKEIAVKQYVDAKHDAVLGHILILRDEQKDIKLMFRTIDDRLYKINETLKN